jgi:hypothetical protein
MKHKRKGKGKRKRPEKGAVPPLLVFTQESLTVAQAAMKVFEQTLQRSKSASEKDTLARDTMESVKRKLHLMRTSVGALCLTTFDYNEKLVLAAAMKQYVIDIMDEPETANKWRKLQLCQQVEQFALQGLGVQLHLPTQD